MEITIECYAELYIVKVNGHEIGRWSYLDGAIEAARKEIRARYAELAGFSSDSLSNAEFRKRFGH
jgi:hypothetical protein